MIRRDHGFNLIILQHSEKKKHTKKCEKTYHIDLIHEMYPFLTKHFHTRDGNAMFVSLRV